MLKSDLSPAAPLGGRLPPTDKTRVVSTRRRVPTSWVSGRTLQPSIESVVANSFVPSDFLVDGQVSGMGTVHPLLTLGFVSTWILPLHVVSSTLKRESSSSVMDGLQRRRRYITIYTYKASSLNSCMYLLLSFQCKYLFFYYGLSVLDQHKIDRGRFAIGKLRHIFTSTICDANKMRLFKATVETIAAYGLESVPMTPSLCRQIGASHRQMVRTAGLS